MLQTRILASKIENVGLRASCAHYDTRYSYHTGTVKWPRLYHEYKIEACFTGGLLGGRIPL